MNHIAGFDHVQVAMPSGQEAIARHFYGVLLGLEEISKPQATAARGGLWFKCGALQLHLGVDERFTAAHKAHPAFRVEAYAQLLTKLAATGYPVAPDRVLAGVERAFTQDPFGNRIELISIDADASRPHMTNFSCMLKHIESIVLFVPDIGSAAAWYAELFDSEVAWENPQFAFIKAAGIVIGFHPTDSKCPGGVGGTTVYWEVENINEAIELLTSRGARLHRGPGVTSFGAGAAMVIDPFGCTIGLNAASPELPTRLNGGAG